MFLLTADMDYLYQILGRNRIKLLTLDPRVGEGIESNVGNDTDAVCGDLAIELGQCSNGLR